MTRYTVYFNNNKAVAAIADEYLMTHEIAKVSDGKVEWFIIPAASPIDAIRLSNEIVNDYLANI